MSRTARGLLLLALVFLPVWLPGFALAENLPVPAESLPALTGRVVDNAGILDAATASGVPSMKSAPSPP